MTLLTATASDITEITITDNTDIEFVCAGRLYNLLIDQEQLDAAFGFETRDWEDPYDGKAYYDEYSVIEIEDWSKSKNITNEDILAVILANRYDCEDVTEYCDKGLAMLRKQARHNLLSYIVTSANKLRSTLKSMSLAMHAAWTKAKILASGVVNFVKVADVDTNKEITVHTRRVADGGTGKNGLMLFKDLEKYETYLKAGLDEAIATAKSFISMHPWQVVSWTQELGV